MCGIVGKVTSDGRVERRLIERMCSLVEHRGPDSRGLYLAEGVGLGIQRLRVIDVETGDQPIFNEDRSVAVVLNGEISNHKLSGETFCAADMSSRPTAIRKSSPISTRNTATPASTTSRGCSRLPFGIVRTDGSSSHATESGRSRSFTQRKTAISGSDTFRDPRGAERQRNPTD